MNVWQRCHGEAHLKPLQLDAWRAVEGQHGSTTRALVDTLDEHEVLENLLEQAKPPSVATQPALHYLLSTPFRYPPLKYGSRFGSRFEPSLWYGSHDVATVFSEVAFYRLVFLQQTTAPLHYLRVLLTVYCVKLKNELAVDLTQSPFDAYRAAISDPARYVVSQQLGQAMRQAGVVLFNYYSARDHQNGINVALFSPQGFATTKPKTPMQTWECIAHREGVEFRSLNTVTTRHVVFPSTQFQHQQQIPVPPEWVNG